MKRIPIFSSLMLLFFLSTASLSAQGIAKNVEEVKTCCKDQKKACCKKAEMAPCCKASKTAMAGGVIVKDQLEGPATAKKTEKAFNEVKALNPKKTTRLKGRKSSE